MVRKESARKSNVDKRDHPEDVFRSSLSHLVFIFTATDPSRPPNETSLAVEIIWHLSVRTYNTSVAEEGLLDETSHAHYEISKQNASHFTMADAKGEEYFQVQQFRNTPKMFGVYTDGIEWNEYYEGQSTSGETMTMNLSQRLFEPGDKMKDLPRLEQAKRNLEVFAEDMVEGMTLSLRYDEKRDEGSFKGSMVATETFIVIRWKWLSALAAQIVLTFVFLVAVIVNTASLGVEVVKSSNMAELLALGEKIVGASEREELVVGLRVEVGKEVMGRLIRRGTAEI